jgi:hypothetical protein
MGPDFCKRKAKEIANNTAKKTYMGLAVVTAQQIRQVGAEVHDSRQHYCGHAHISYGIVAPPPNEPQESEANRKLFQMTRAILEAARYYEDPDPASTAWEGPPL